MTNFLKRAVPLKTLIIILFLVSAVYIAYHDALNNDFQSWDTKAYVVNNAHITAFTWENIQWMFTAFYKSNWHPLTWLSHATDYALFGLNPWGHHLVNVIIHGLNSILVFGLVIVLMTFKRATEKSSWLARVDNKILLAASVAALFFGIHPQHVESVVWVAERKDVLCLFFILLALLSYVFYNTAQTAKARFYGYFSTLLCFVLALLAKPMAVTFPVILLLIDVYPLNRTHLTAFHPSSVVSYQKLLIEKIPFFGLTLFSVILTLLAQQNAIPTVDMLGIQMRFLNAFNSLIFYLSKFIFPIGLSPYYPYPSYTHFHEYYPSLIPVVASFLITFVCGYLWYQKKYYWLIAWLFYLVTLSPVIGIIQVGTQAAADRYVYLPTLPFYILLGVGIATVLYSTKTGKIIKLATILGIILYGLVLVPLTQKQTTIWRNDLTFWDYVVKYAPERSFPQFRLGTVYFEMGYYEKALEHYHQAVFLEPQNMWWYANLPMTYLNLNRLPEALAVLNRLEEEDAGYNLDSLYAMKGWIYLRQGLVPKAQSWLQKALNINPDNQMAQDFLSRIPSNLEPKALE
ncbi:MAG: tetratricopeptide repeat protein [Candidatus Parabeggiatoa sp.]|nr:tetratricopeptide repeat protein [Candidatus Parabeggiatoa sp.]